MRPGPRLPCLQPPGAGTINLQTNQGLSRFICFITWPFTVISRMTSFSCWPGSWLSFVFFSLSAGCRRGNAETLRATGHGPVGEWGRVWPVIRAYSKRYPLVKGRYTLSCSVSIQPARLLPSTALNSTSTLILFLRLVSIAKR